MIDHWVEILNKYIKSLLSVNQQWWISRFRQPVCTPPLSGWSNIHHSPRSPSWVVSGLGWLASLFCYYIALQYFGDEWALVSSSSGLWCNSVCCVVMLAHITSTHLEPGRSIWRSDTLTCFCLISTFSVQQSHLYIYFVETCSRGKFYLFFGSCCWIR